MSLKIQGIPLLFFFTLAVNILTAQVRSTQEVAFDLDKRSIGTLPFDERFKLSAFETKYDSIHFEYEINEDFKDKKPNYFIQGEMDLTIDKSTGKAIFPHLVGPLHPNVLYDFKFRVSKKIDLNDDQEKALRQEIFELIKTFFKDSNSTNSASIDDFKTEVQALLKKYAGTDSIVNAKGNPIDLTNTPLFDTKLSDAVNSIENYYVLLNDTYNENEDDKNNVVSAKNYAIRTLSSTDYTPIFQRIKVALERNQGISESFKNLLDAPINVMKGVNEKLTLRQYLDYIIEDPVASLTPVINGSEKIVGNNHEPTTQLDRESLKLLQVAFDKLTRNAVKNSWGNPYFKADEKTKMGRLARDIGTVAEEQNTYLNIKKRLKSGADRVPNLLKNAMAKKEIKISEQVNIDALAEKNAYIGLDAGVGFAFGSTNGVFTYQGANFYFRPVNHQTSFKELQDWDEFLKRFSVYLGIAQIITDEEDRFESLLGDSSILIGAGFRLNRGFRINVGGLLHYLKDRIPTVDNKKITVSPTISLSIDINLVKALGAVGGALNLD